MARVDVESKVDLKRQLGRGVALGVSALMAPRHLGHKSWAEKVRD